MKKLGLLAFFVFLAAYVFVSIRCMEEEICEI